ncbi:MAG: ABC transporter permease [Calditrichaeota bacterium]|nr:ABC transporter permease [Calditrichota bacterium]
MNNKDIFVFSFSEIKSNLLRSTLAVLSVIVGISAFISVVSLSEGMNKKLMETIERLGGYDLFEIHPSRKNITIEGDDIIHKYEITEQLIFNLNKRFSAVFAPVIFGPKINLSDDNLVSVHGVSPEYFDIFSHELDEGRLIHPVDVENKHNVILINEKIKKEKFAVSDVTGKYLTLSGFRFEVVGVIDGHRAYIPITTMAQKIQDVRPIRDVYVKVGNYKEMDSLMENVRIFLDQWTGESGLFRFTIPSKNQEKFYSLEKTYTRFIMIISIFILLVGGIGIMNIMLASIKERIREIGIKKAIGAKNTHIFYQFLIESVLIFLVGGVIGMILGITSVNVITEKILVNFISGKTEPAMSLKVILAPLLVSIGTGLVFGLYPAVKASRIAPVNALRYE